MRKALTLSLVLFLLTSLSAQRPASAPDTAPAGKAPDTVILEELTWAEVRDLKQSLGKDVTIKADAHLHHEQFDVMAV